MSERQTVTDDVMSHYCAVCKQKIPRGEAHYLGNELHPKLFCYPRVHIAELAVLEQFEAVMKRRRKFYVNPNSRRRLQKCLTNNPVR